MDWIEQIFHVDPDGGNGLVEVMVVTAAGLLLLGAVVALYLRRRGARRSDSKAIPAEPEGNS